VPHSLALVMGTVQVIIPVREELVASSWQQREHTQPSAINLADTEQNTL
jgi:hypothetical protein